MKAVLVLLSGGMDSATVLACALRREKAEKVQALVIDYGQVHHKEIASALNIASYFKVACAVAHLDLMPFAGRSQILNPTNQFSTEHSSTPAHEPGIAASWVPGRNVMLLGAAASFAYLRDIHVVGTGVNYTDYSGYPDCRPEFLRPMSDALSKALACEDFAFYTPVLHLSKKQIVELGQEYGVPWHLTWSCYRGGEVPCGQCGACSVRAKGFDEAGLTDPALAPA